MKRLFFLLTIIAITAITVLGIDQLIDQSLAVLFIDQLIGQGDIIFLAGPITLLQLKDKRKLLVEVNEKLIKDGKAGFRDLNKDEKQLFDNNIAELLKNDNEIRRIEHKSQKQILSAGQVITTDQESFSLIRTIRNLANKQQMHEADQIVLDQGESDFTRDGIDPEGICLPMVDHSHEKRADILAGTATAGAEIVSTDVLDLLGPLRNVLVFTKAGAKYLTGLVGNVDIPKYAGSTATWKTEVEASGDAAGAHSELPLSPMRITGHMDVSKRYLIQDAAGAEGLLKTDLVLAVAGLLESTALSKIAAVAGTNPAGLLPDADAKFAGAVPTWGNVVDLEAAIDLTNALTENLAYITHPAIRGILKQTVKVGTTDSKMLMEGSKELNGYPCLSTSNMSSVLATLNNEYGLAFANWGHLVIAQWGGIDLVVDPYSLASEAQVRIVVNSYWDFVFRHPGAMAFGSCLLA